MYCYFVSECVYGSVVFEDDVKVMENFMECVFFWVFFF